MSSLRSRFRRALVSSTVCMLAAVALSGCGTEKKQGGLVIVVDTDLTMPKDLDRLAFQVTQLDEVLLSEDFELGDAGKVLPVDFRIAPTGKPDPVLVKAIGWKGGYQRIERSARVEVPSDRTAWLHVPLNYLCDGTVNEDGSSSCGPEQTCKQGVCGNVVVGDLPTYTGETSLSAATAGVPDDGDEVDCFNALECFSDAQGVTIDPGTCSFEAPPQASSGVLNVALRLHSADGICDVDACWVLLEVGDEGWTFDGERVTLPPGICLESPDMARFEVMVSDACVTKPFDWPICGRATEGTQTPDGMNPGGPVTPDFGDACQGARVEACGNCGTRRRECRNGQWTEWSECTADGLCMPDEMLSCGYEGMQVCGGDCQWSQCVGQGCVGAVTEACGDCGTRWRSCENGAWTEWSDCVGQGVCAPNEERTCGSDGLQACGGACEWGDCASQICTGAPSEACGMCGTRQRVCETATATWGEWLACEMQGDCMPNQMRECGRGGTQTCGGNCLWDAGCRGQTCEGAATRTCGNCGTQSRTCDSTTGEWQEWSACSESGECAPNEMRECGRDGTQTCGGNCLWDPICEGQTCTGASSRACGSCGRQTRTCDQTMGEWSPWTPCSSSGECSGGETRTCGRDGTQTCSDSCDWESCIGQSCPGSAPTEACGRCDRGQRRRSCDGDTGQWIGPWSECDQPDDSCTPGRTQSCSGGGSRICGDDCRWPSSCTLTCSGNPPPFPCGMCDRGRHPAVCNMQTGTWQANESVCNEPGDLCRPGVERECDNGNGDQTCDDECLWGSCEPRPKMCSGNPPQFPCGRCDRGLRPARCDTETGEWEGDPGVCNEPDGTCTPDRMRTCNNDAGDQRCSDECRWGECIPRAMMCTATPPSTSCGRCERGSRTVRCNPDNGQWETGNCNVPDEACVPETKRDCDRGQGEETCNTQCNWGECVPKNGPCTENCETCDDPPPSTSCGPCERGTRTVECNTNTGDWDAGSCNFPDDLCTPEEDRSCDGGSGDQTCTNECRWGACVPRGMSCDGDPPTTSCGPCGRGMRTVECDMSSGDWDPGECSIPQDVCMPGADRGCDSSNGPGNQECEGDCRWGTCTPSAMTCDDPPPSTSCGPCGRGTRTVECDTTSGDWREGQCNLPDDVCMPPDDRTCETDGRTGDQMCGDDCRWGGCMPRAMTCSGTMPGERCGRCERGSRTVMCNPITGQWDTSDCNEPDNVCTPDTTRPCDGGDGTETCDDECNWGECVPMQLSCDDSNRPLPSCGRCGDGTQTVMCDMDEGDWVTGPCQLPDSSCEPGAMRDCNDDGRPGRERCNDSCDWGSCTPTELSCDDSNRPPDTCGPCDDGRQEVSCNRVTGMWNTGDCVVGSEVCEAGSMRDCIGGRQTCTSECRWDMCEPTVMQCNGDPPDTRCGLCNLGRALFRCDTTMGVWEATGGCDEPDGLCDPEDQASRNCPNGGTQMCSGSDCTWSDCECPDGRQLCDDQCVSTTDNDQHCGQCGNNCTLDGRECQGTMCVGGEPPEEPSDPPGENEPGDPPGEEPGDPPGEEPGDPPGEEPGDPPGEEPGDGDPPPPPGDGNAAGARTQLTY